MKLKEIKINNYKNLDGIHIHFHEKVNFLIGENNLGKTNLLNLLNTLFNKRSFTEDDFFDISDPIEVEFSLILEDIERGFFDDLFDPENCNQVNLIALQESIDDNISFYHRESQTSISSNLVRCVNYINYDSLRNPNYELNFDKNKGVGKFLNHIIVKYLDDNEAYDIDFIQADKLSGLLISVNQVLQKLKTFKDFSIEAAIEDNVENVLSKLVTLIDCNQFSLNKLGYGVQFSTLISLSILERILNLSGKRLEQSILDDDSGSENKKCIPILLGLDEPEIHLHPYAQRALIKYLYKIINNIESDFSSLLKTTFEIDRLLGQIIVVSHSPSILLDDYKQIIRFARDEDRNLVIKSGITISLGIPTEKQLMKNLPYIKEVLFSKTVILVEGDSELGAFPIFSQRMDIDFDELGISVIQAGSAESIPPLMKLLDEFNIFNLSLMDADKRADYPNVSNLFFTQGIDFEEDMYESFSIPDYVKYLEDEFPDQNKAHFFIGKINSLDIDIAIEPRQPIYSQINEITEPESILLKSNSKDDILSYLRSNKGILTGRDLAKYVTNIPQVYTRIIENAQELAQRC